MTLQRQAGEKTAKHDFALKKFMTSNISAALGLQQRKHSASGAIHVDLSPAQKAPAHH
jgi:hypothetical protein